MLTLLLCCIFWCLPAPRADLTRFRRVIVRWVSTAKRKTRLHTDFRSARRSKQINPRKMTLLTQFLRRIEEEMLKVHVSLLATQFRPQRLRYDTFFCEIASLATSNIASSNVSGTFSRTTHNYYSPDQGYSATICQHANQNAPRVPSCFICQTPRGALFPSTNRNEV